MNILPIAPILLQHPEVSAVFADRIYEDIAPNKTPYPYAVWSNIGGQPDNNLADLPVIDQISFQLVVYDIQATRASEYRKMIAEVLESHCYITGTHPNYHHRKGDTDIFGRGFDGSWWIDR